MPFGRVAVWRACQRRRPFYICRLMNDTARSSPFAAMALAVTVIALSGAATRAAAEGAPCRTPCLSVEVPREPAEKPEKPEHAQPRPKPAPVAVARPSNRPRVQAAAAPSSPEVQREAVARTPAPSKRCTDINMRAAVGEPLSEQDMKTLRSQC